MAVKVQKVFRGHYSRTHYSDYYRRRLYLSQVAHTGHQLAQSIALSSSLRHSILSASVAQQRDARVRQVLAHTHHLLGTASMPGVFSSRWGPDYEARVDGQRVEDVIKDVWRERQAELRRLRSDVRREQRRMRGRKEVVEMHLRMEDEDAPIRPAEEEEKTQISAADEDGGVGREDGDRGDGRVRFPPIHAHKQSAAGEEEGRAGEGGYDGEGGQGEGGAGAESLHHHLTRRPTSDRGATAAQEHPMIEQWVYG